MAKTNKQTRSNKMSEQVTAYLIHIDERHRIIRTVDGRLVLQQDNSLEGNFTSHRERGVLQNIDLRPELIKLIKEKF